MIFQSFWTGAPLSPYEWLCIKSFLDHGHGYELYSYETLADLPHGCVLRDAREIIPEAQRFTPTHGYAIFADLFRYKLLALRGGWWVDTDILCLTPDWPDVQRQAGRERVHPQQRTTIADDRVNNAVLRAAAGDPVMRRAHKSAQALGADAPFGATGPDLLTLLIREGGQGYTVQPPETFYPVDWFEAGLLLQVQDRVTIGSLQAQGAVCLHFWNDVLKRQGVDKRSCPPAGSLLHAAFAKAGLLGCFSQ